MKREKWWQNTDLVFVIGVTVVVTATAICVAAVQIVKHLYPNGLNP